MMGYFITNLSFNSLVKEFLKPTFEHLAKLQAKWLCHTPHFVLHFCHQRCRTRQISKITGILRTETTTRNCCYSNRQINASLLSINIKLLQTSLLTERPTPSATGRLLIMDGFLLQYLFLCYSSCVQSVIGFLCG